MTSTRARPEMVTNTQTLTATYSSLPGSFITPEGLQRRGWEAAPSGHWLVETSEPLTSDQLATVRDVAAAAGPDHRGTTTNRPGCRPCARGPPPSACCSPSASSP